MSQMPSRTRINSFGGVIWVIEQGHCMSVYEHVHAKLYVIVFARSQVQASAFPIDPTRNLKQPAARLSVERALSADILRPFFDSRSIRLIRHVLFIRRMSKR